MTNKTISPAQAKIHKVQLELEKKRIKKGKEIKKVATPLTKK